LIKIYKLNNKNVADCANLLMKQKKDSEYFNELGWNKNQIFLQFDKNINYSFGLFNCDKLMAFMFGDLIFVEKFTEYEILFIYVNKAYRKRGLASNLLENLFVKKNHLNLKKIFLEVSKDNKQALELYQKYNFKLFNVRKNYYQIKNRKIDALCFVKNL